MHLTHEAINLLQSEGIISDLCIEAEDIATVDAAKAIEFLVNNKQTKL